MGRIAAMIWGIGGVLLALGHAVVRLAPRAATALASDLELQHLVFLVLWLLFMGYAEGWRGFHQRFSPSVVRRAFQLRDEWTWVRAVLAPAYCMSLFGAPKRQMIVSWCVVIGVAGLIAVVRMLPAPWRGLVDAGVVLGLGIGSLSIVHFTIQAIRLGPESLPERPRKAR